MRINCPTCQEEVYGKLSLSSLLGLAVFENNSDGYLIPKLNRIIIQDDTEINVIGLYCSYCNKNIDVDDCILYSDSCRGPIDEFVILTLLSGDIHVTHKSKIKKYLSESSKYFKKDVKPVPLKGVLLHG